MQTNVEGADAVEVESENHVPTSWQQHTIESSRRTDTASTKAESIWTLISALNGFSFRSNDHLNDTFAAICFLKETLLNNLVWDALSQCM